MDYADLKGKEYSAADWGDYGDFLGWLVLILIATKPRIIITMNEVIVIPSGELIAPIAAPVIVERKPGVICDGLFRFVRIVKLPCPSAHSK